MRARQGGEASSRPAAASSRQRVRPHGEGGAWGRRPAGAARGRRQGSPLVEAELRRVSVAGARSIVVLSTCDDADQARSCRRHLRLGVGVMP